VSNLKKASTALLLIAFFLLFFALSQTHVNASATSVATTSSSADIQVDQVTHIVKIQDYGLVIVNDTIKLSSESGGLLQNFLIGFPFRYGFNLDYSFAYNALNPDERLEVELDVGLGRIGFYGVKVIFPEPGVNLGDVGSYNLTVIFVFSNLVSLETETLFNVTFPMYPSLIQNASSCNVTITLPHNTNYTKSTFEEKELDFDVISLGSSQILNHKKTPLDSFQYEPAWLEFNVTYFFPMFEVNEVKREITLDQWGGVHLSDFYHITSKGSEISTIEIRLPEGVRRPVSARDELGDLSLDLDELPNVTVRFRTVLKKDEEIRFTVTYSLPWENYVNQYDWRDYNLTFSFLEEIHWTIRKLSVTITLPEGAEFQSSEPSNPDSVEKSVFQETVTFTLFNVTPFHDLDFDLTYRYLVVWASFRPTLWMGVLVIIVGAVAFLWRAPKPPPVPTVPVPPEDLRSFVEAYERKTRILLELESMEEQLRKGRIPRRRYKVRKKMLEGRLSTLSRDLSGLREKIGATGPKYANIMRQIEVAETMLEGVQTDIRRVEARYRRGEISKGAYRRLLEEYHRRRESAKTTIDGVLLRLREEIR
jgi:hypothetical protein